MGAAELDSQVPSNLNVVTSFSVELQMNGPANRFELILGRSDRLTIGESEILPGAPLPGAERLSISRGDPVTVGLGYEDEMVAVFSGEVNEVLPGIKHLRVMALDGARKLQQMRINQTYEQQTTGDIVADVASTAGVTVGNKDAGIEFPFYVIDDQKTGYEHILELAQKNGYDFYFDDENRLIFKAFSETPPAKVFRYGVDVLNLEIAYQDPRVERVEVRGESPASSQGIEKAHWLVKSFEDSLGVAGTGSRVENLTDPVIRTKAAADAMAAAKLSSVSANVVSGRVRVLMAPDVKLGDIVQAEGFPDGTLNAAYHIRGLQHIYSPREGFISEFRFRAAGKAGLGLGL
jgi:phage protein D